MDAVYLITPSEESVRALMRDFEHPNRPLYRAAHVYFTEGTSSNDSTFPHKYIPFFLWFYNLYSVCFCCRICLKITAIPNDIFQLFKKANVVKYMKACTEINIAFIPYEQQVILILFLFMFLCFKVWWFGCVNILLFKFNGG